MATTPSLKGSVITDLAEDIKKLIAKGELSQTIVEQHLTADDIATVEAEIVPSKFYDVQFYKRCAELLRDTVGGGRNEYLKQRGLEKGKKLIEAGLYQQMEYATRTRVQEEASPEARFKAYGHDLRLFMTLSRSILNFTEWSTMVDRDHADRHMILVEDAAEYPDALAWATEGLIESMAASHGLPNLWSHSRERRDQIVFRMSRSL